MVAGLAGFSYLIHAETSYVTPCCTLPVTFCAGPDPVAVRPVTAIAVEPLCASVVVESVALSLAIQPSVLPDSTPGLPKSSTPISDSSMSGGVGIVHCSSW